MAEDMKNRVYYIMFWETWKYVFRFKPEIWKTFSITYVKLLFSVFKPSQKIIQHNHWKACVEYLSNIFRQVPLKLVTNRSLNIWIEANRFVFVQRLIAKSDVKTRELSTLLHMVIFLNTFPFPGFKQPTQLRKQLYRFYTSIITGFMHSQIC